MRYALTAAVAFMVAATACQAATGTTPGQSATAPSGSCHARTEAGQPLPDPTCTPGATNPNVTQATIATTICRSGWATQQRQRYLPLSLSSKYKRQVEDAYGLPHSTDAEGDHDIPIEVGGLPGPMPGAPAFTANFWPERNDHPRPGVINSKDLVENALHAAVCSHRVTLAAAQQAIAGDWVTAEQRLGIG